MAKRWQQGDGHARGCVLAFKLKLCRLRNEAALVLGTWWEIPSELRQRGRPAPVSL
ncbi:MAG: hypothetical protein JW940_27000 [Polyangiaceae bacterium]|nr:hypothetical protein [Polyangiaceae bacterium]